MQFRWRMEIGCVVHEVLPEIHSALQEKKITCVKFAWIKWITAWPQGYYVGIDISKKGYWEATVVSSHSTH